MLRKTKAIRLEVKQLTEEGTFEGLLSPYGNVDGGNDVVEPGAYTKTLKERGNKVPLLWSHKADTPIGQLTLDDRKDGLWCLGKLFLGMAAAKEAYTYLKNTEVSTGLSIGFETIKDSIENGVRHLKEIRLLEGSVVLFPMNEEAIILSVKQRHALAVKGDFSEELAEIRTLNGLYDMRCAFDEAIRSVVWSDDMDRDAKIAAAETIMQQFNQAFSSFFPNYIDTLAEIYGPSETWGAKRVEIKERQQKAGATFSAANRKSIQSIAEQAKDIHEKLTALVAEEAGEATSEAKAAETKTEPESSTRQAEPLIKNILTALRA